MHQSLNQLLRVPLFSCFFIICILVAQYALGQEDQVDQQLWADYTLRYDLNEKIERKVHSIGGDAGIRGIISNQDWNQFYIRPNFTYRLPRIANFGVAAAWFGTFNEDTTNVNEIRFHQDFNARFPESEYITLFYRIRFEQRFFYYSTGARNNVFRLRFLIGLESPDIRLGAGRRPFYFQIFYEIFQDGLNTTSQEVYVNQARPTFIFAHRLSPSWRYEVNIVPQRSRLYEDDGLLQTQMIFRFRVFHRIFYSKK